MSLLQDIQVSLLDENAKIAPILFKLRFLADRLESNLLEDWVRYETEGYPDRELVPPYRQTNLHYTGTLTDGRRTINNTGIPLHIIKEHCGESWTQYGIIEPLPTVEGMISNGEEKEFGVDASNLKLLLDGKLYQGFTVIDISARFSSGVFISIVSTVRSKILDFILELERKVPVSADIGVGRKIEVTRIDTDKVTHITQNFFHAPVQHITTSGAGSSINIKVIQGDVSSLKSTLEAIGLSSEDAKELANIADTEKPSPNRSFGQKASEWIGARVSKGADGLLRIGGKILEKDITEALRQFYENLT